MSATGDDADDQYRRALADLRKHADLVVVEIARSHGECNARDYPTRWAHVYAASELRHPATLPFLRNLVSTPIPPEESPDPHSLSTVGEETILRTTAVEGIGFLARDRADATDALFEVLRQPSLSLRRAAVQSLLATPRGRKLRARIAKALPEEQQFLLALKAVDVRNVPQIKNPERHLSEAGRRGGIAPAPSLPGDEANTAPGSEAPRRKE
jgi:HEAT repeat protein